MGVKSGGVQSEKFLKDAARGPRLGLPASPDARKRTPIARGVMDYFPAALAAVAEISLLGNEQHNPGEELHWARNKSQDHADCISRHLIERGSLDVDGGRHSAKLAWRALALLQTELEEEARLVSEAWDRAVNADCDRLAKSNFEPEMTASEIIRRQMHGRTVMLPTPQETLRRIQAMEQSDGKDIG